MIKRGLEKVFSDWIVMPLDKAIVVQQLFHPKKTRRQTAKPIKIDAHIQDMKQQKT